MSTGSLAATAPVRVQETLQDRHRGRLIHYRALPPPAYATLGERPTGHHGGKALVGHSHRHLEQRRERVDVSARCLSGGSFPTRQRTGKPDHHFDHLVLGDELGKLVEIASRARRETA